MRIRKVKIKNFTSHVDSSFSFLKNDRDNGAAPLVIIRAENGTGKTQFFKAISWAIWGAKDGLGKTAVDKMKFLSPEWMKDREIEISVEIEYEIMTHNRVVELYSLTRKAKEVLDSANPLSRAYKNERVTLAELTSGGYSEIIPEVITDHFPHKLKDIFIMDGESTDNLLHSGKNTGSKIKKIVTELLGIENAENTLRLLKRIDSNLTKSLKSIPELSDIADKKAKLSDEYEEEENVKSQIKSMATDHENIIDKIKATKRKLTEAGADSQDELTSLITELDGKLENHSEIITLRENELYSELKSDHLAYKALQQFVDPVIEHLGDLHDRGEIPKTAKPVLLECLSSQECVCGSGLDPEDESDVSRIDHIKTQIDKYKKGDDKSLYLSESLIKLTDISKRIEVDPRSPNEITATECISKHSETIANEHLTLGHLEKKRKETLELLKSCDEGKIQQYSQQLDSLEHEEKRLLNEIQSNKGRLQKIASVILDLKKEIDSLSDSTTKQNSFFKQQNLVNLCIDTLIGIKNHRQNIKRQELSDLIGKIFIQLIGSEQGGMYTNAAIDDNYNLVVHSDSGPLNATWVLNGASLRMLAVTFIWSVTKLAGDLEIEQENSFPRIFDTPTGMISGPTRQAYYKFVCGESTAEGTHNQLIMLTTKAEREGCYNILDSYNPIVITVSSNHMPQYNQNEWPETAVGRLLSKICECNSFHQTCVVCTRTELN